MSVFFCGCRVEDADTALGVGQHFWVLEGDAEPCLSGG